MTESQILANVLIDVTALPATIAWRANSGLFLTMDGKRPVRANIPGCGDVIGCRAVTITKEMVGAVIGEAFAIEIKALNGRQRATQENFQRRWQAAGGLYIVARSPYDALVGLAR